MELPAGKKENFAALKRTTWRRGKSARASPTPYHTLPGMKSGALVSSPNLYQPCIRPSERVLSYLFSQLVSSFQEAARTLSNPLASVVIETTGVIIQGN